MRKQTFKLINVLLAVVLLLGILMPIVNAEPDLTKTEGSLKITKYQVGDGMTADSKTPLAGVTFDIYKVADDETSTAIPTDVNIVNTKQSKTTGDDGIVTFTDLALGRYLVVESAAPESVSEKIANFLVDIPMTGEDGASLDYDVEVYPKNNTVYGGFVLYKENTDGQALEGVKFELQKQDNTTSAWVKYNTDNLVTDADGKITLTGLPKGNYRFVELETLEGYVLDNKTTYDFEVISSNQVEPATITVTNEKPTLTKNIITETLVDGSGKIGDTISYQIETPILTMVDRLNTYQIVEKLDKGLDYTTDSLKVFMVDVNDIETELVKDTDYSLAYDATENTLTVQFLNKSKLNATTEGFLDNITLKITYEAKMNDNADALATGNNTNTVLTYSTIVAQNYNNETNNETTQTKPATLTEDTKVYTAGFYIKKVDSSKAVITTGATFKVAATEADAKAGNYLTDANGDEIVLTTDENGFVSYKGLAYGTYWLVETKAPTYKETTSNGEVTKNYNLLRAPVEITVSNATYAEDKAVEIINKKGFELPATGGVGTVLITALGLAVIASGVVVYKKGKNEENN